MLALYHLFSGIAPTELMGIDAVMEEAEARSLPTARRVVLVGNKISPGNPSTKPDGTVIRTLWGELAWQLGGKKAFARIRADDEKATSPGDVLRELFNEYAPSLILIDEWVAYARQLHDQGDLPAGGFETQFTFAQVLTESAKLVKNCLLVIYRLFRDTRLTDLPRLTIVVGANGSGKSTLFDVFSFLKEALTQNVASAVSRRGGFRELVSRGESWTDLHHCEISRERRSARYVPARDRRGRGAPRGPSRNPQVPPRPEWPTLALRRLLARTRHRNHERSSIRSRGGRGRS